MSFDEIEQESAVENTESQTSESTPAPAEQEQQAETPAQESAEQNVPYSRFKELVDQKNEMSRRIDEMARSHEAKLGEFSKRFEQYNKPPEQAKPTNPFVEDLKKINPEYAKTMEDLLSTREQVAQFQKYQEQQQAEQLRNQFNGKVNGFMDSNKVPDRLKTVYRAVVENMTIANKPDSLDAVDTYLKQVHQIFSEHETEVKRSERASYVQDKKKDASTPASQTGGAPVPSAKADGPKNRAEVVAEIAKKIREAKSQI